MGYGAYSYTSHQALTKNRQGKSAQSVFTQSHIHPSMNPYGVVARESRDSADNPNSLAIIFSLDISGSMGSIPRQLALKELPEFMKMLTVCQIPDPQVLFTAFSDHEYDGRPLQVGQFETTAELMDQWLTRCSLRGGGEQAPSYGNNTGLAYESYDLAFHFAAHHTSIDCFEKRGKKGYLFVTGDEPPYPGLRAEVVKHVIGTDVKDAPFSSVIDEVKRQYEPFFLVPDKHRYSQIQGPWRKLLGDRVIPMHDPSHTCAVAAALVGLGEGSIQGAADLKARLKETNYLHIDPVLDALSGWINSKERS